MSDTTKEQWPEGRDDKFWLAGDPSPFQGPEQGGVVPPRDTPDKRREVED
jgi:hypothetical protein